MQYWALGRFWVQKAPVKAECWVNHGTIKVGKDL